MFVISVFFIWLLFIRRYNKTGATKLIEVGNDEVYDRIGGWLIILSISLILSPVRQLIELSANDSFFQKSIWVADPVIISLYVYKVFIDTEFLANALFFTGMIYSIYLLFKRRDIFPQTLFVLLAGRLIYEITNVVAGFTILEPLLDEATRRMH